MATKELELAAKRADAAAKTPTRSVAHARMVERNRGGAK
jgi:hypothetical protein